MKKLLLLLAITLGLVSCGDANNYGDKGWQLSEDHSQIESTNPNGDILLTQKPGMFGEVYHLLLENSPLGDSCGDGSEGQGILRLKSLPTKVDFEFPEDTAQNFSISATLMYGQKSEEPNKPKGAFIFAGQQALPSDAMAKFSSFNKLDIKIADQCNNKHIVPINIVGDLAELSTELR